MSPFCPGRTLADCPSPYAGEWRRDIEQWLAAGVDPAEIKRRLRARVPDADLSGSPQGEFGWIWVLLGALGLGLMVVLVRRLGMLRPVAEVPPAIGEDAELDARLALELDLAADEGSSDEPKTAEPKTGAVKTEDSKPDDSKSDDAKSDEPKIDDAKTDEANA